MLYETSRQYQCSLFPMDESVLRVVKTNHNKSSLRRAVMQSLADCNSAQTHRTGKFVSMSWIRLVWKAVQHKAGRSVHLKNVQNEVAGWMLLKYGQTEWCFKVFLVNIVWENVLVRSTRWALSLWYVRHRWMEKRSLNTCLETTYLLISIMFSIL